MKTSTKKSDSTEENVCVTCSTPGECEDVFMLAFEDTQFSNIFYSFMGFELSEKSKLKYMCLECINTIISYHTFKKAALKSYEELSKKETEIEINIAKEAKQQEKNSEQNEHIVLVSIEDANLIDVDDNETDSDDERTVESKQPDIDPEANSSDQDTIEDQPEIQIEFADIKQEEDFSFDEGESEEKPLKSVKEEEPNKLSAKKLKENNQWQCSYCYVIISKNDPAAIKKHSDGTCMDNKDNEIIQSIKSEDLVVLCCLSCKFRTGFEVELRKHMLSHKGCEIFEVPPRNFGCAKCEYKSYRKRDVRRHVLIHLRQNKRELASCTQCDFTSRYHANLERHIQRNHGNGEVPAPKMYQCEKCDFSSDYKHSVVTHQLQHKELEEQELYFCNDCDFKTIYKTNLRSHVQLHKPIEQLVKYGCEVCGFSTLYKKTHRSHMLCHYEPKITEGNETRKRRRIRMNRRRKVGEGTPVKEEEPVQKKKYKGRKVGTGYVWDCDECNYTANCAIALRSHKMSHTRQTSFFCDQCTYKAKTSTNLKDHMITHKDPNEAKIHQCEYCPFRTAHRSALKLHLLRHVPKKEKMFFCDQCDYSTIYGAGFKLHQNLHKNPEDVVKIKCGTCAYQSTCESNIRRHEWKRHGVKRIKRKWTIKKTE